jgi:hypothetical protein
MILRHLALWGFCAVLTGCTAASAPTATPGSVIGYRYHDGNHQNEVVSPSPVAVENARRGVWLWPPAGSIKPG